MELDRHGFLNRDSGTAEVIGVLDTTLSRTKEIRSKAEGKLIKLAYQQKGFGSLLIRIAMEMKDIPASTQLAALFALRSCIELKWMKYGSSALFYDSEAYLRNSLLEPMFAANTAPKARELLSQMVSWVKCLHLCAQEVLRYATSTLMAQTPFHVQLIGRRDFPNEWPELTNTLCSILSNSQVNGNKVLVALSTLNELLKRYRYSLKPAEKWPEILSVVSRFAEPLTQLFLTMCQYTPKKGSPPLPYDQRRVWLQVLLSITRNFRSLITHDTPAYFEQNLAVWMEGFLGLMAVSPDECGADGTLDQLKEAICKIITLLSQRYEKGHEAFGQGFVAAASALRTMTSARRIRLPKVKLCPLVMELIVDHLLRHNLSHPSAASTSAAAAEVAAATDLTPVAGYLLGEWGGGTNDDPLVATILDAMPDSPRHTAKEAQAKYYPDLKIVGCYQTVKEPTEVSVRACLQLLEEKFCEEGRPVVWLSIDAARLGAPSVYVLRPQQATLQNALLVKLDIDERFGEQMLRSNLLSFANSTPMGFWREGSLAHRQLIANDPSNPLRREWLGAMEPAFWGVLLPDNQIAEMEASERTAIIATVRQLQREGKWEEAGSMLGARLNLYPIDTGLLAEAGIVAEHQQKWLEAERFYTRLLFAEKIRKAEKQDPQSQQRAKSGLQRILPHVEHLQNEMLRKLYKWVDRLEHIPRCTPALRQSIVKAFHLGAHDTLSIEGNSLSLKETTDLLTGDRTRIDGHDPEEHGEVHGLVDATHYILGDEMQLGQITLENLLQLHRRVVGKVLWMQEHAGVVRLIDVRAGKLRAPAWREVPQLLAKFIQFFNHPESLQRIDVVELAAYCHLWLVTIHPFLDGNGRTTRLIMDFFLAKAGLPSFIVPANWLKLQGYYDALYQSTLGYHREFILFIMSMLASRIEKHVEEAAASFPSQLST